MSYPHTRLLIVGGGPVGLFLALKVGRLGIDVTVAEAEPTIIPSPRAIGYLTFFQDDLQ
jgi:2-polyprenyl-6-methoxyphenol hydroxylase-like FAD-dependent oxidoreductase